MAQKKNRILFIIILIFFFSSFAFSDENSKSFEYIKLVPGVPLDQAMPITAEGPSYKTYTFDVAEDVIGIRIYLEKSQADLDFHLHYGSDILSYADADHSSETELWNETIYISRFSEPSLKPGTYFLDVAYQFEKPPRLDNRELKEVGYILNYEAITASADRRIPANMPARITLLPERGMFSVFEVEVPVSAAALRIDIFGSQVDTDFFVSRGKPALEKSQALFTADSLLGQESLIIDRNSPSPLEAGIYYVSVFDQHRSGYPEELSVLVSFSAKPAEQLLVIPQFPFARDSIENALFATVEIIGESSKGSGCLVSPAGHILTNYHLLKNKQGNPVKTAAVAVNLQAEYPAVELFKAELLAFDEKKDMALLQIKTGFYDQPLPFRYRFPFFPLGNPKELMIGQPLGFFGYPGIGGTGSRVSITYSQGVVSGFEKNSVVSLIKTDGLIHEGSSGGAAINSYGELMGITTLFIEKAAGQLGFVHSLEMVPREWINIISAAK